jgi:hypothetical protein
VCPGRGNEPGLGFNIYHGWYVHPASFYPALLTSVSIGMTTVEHSLPISSLYNDVLTLYALSGTGATPTHIVNYGGAWGEQLVWARHDVPNDAKYAKHFARGTC